MGCLMCLDTIAVAPERLNIYPDASILPCSLEYFTEPCRLRSPESERLDLV